MRISSTGRYGMRIMLDVALHSSAAPATRQDIADRQRVTPDYIAQLARRLVSAGLLATRKGPGGGYLLGKEPALIRLGDVLRALQETISIAPCMEPNTQTDCDLVGECATRVVWSKLGHIVQAYLDALTLADLLEIDHRIRSTGEDGRMDAFALIESNWDARALATYPVSTTSNTCPQGDPKKYIQGKSREKV